MSILSRFLTDVIVLEKTDGRFFDSIKAGVQPKVILVADVTLPIEEKDKIIRLLPSGVKEIFVVTDPGYQAGIGGIKPHYQIKYRRESEIDKKVAPQNITYNVSGPNARINIGSTDSSTNISNSEKLFTEIRELLTARIADQDERTSLLSKVDELEASQGTKGYVSKYQQFMAQAANHMTVLAPILPALANLIPS